MLYAYNLESNKEKRIVLPDLIYKNINFSRFFSSIISENEILGFLYVLSGIKSAARLTINENKLSFVQDICSALGVFVLKSNFCVGADKIGGASYFYRKISDSKGEALVHIYISLNQNHAISLKKSEDENNNVNLGKLLNYPSCCIKNFSKGKYSYPGDYFMNSIKAPTFSPLPFLNNVALWPFGINILCHFPCQPACRDSLNLATKYANWIRRINENYLNFIERELRSLIICRREGGLLYSNSYSKTKHGIVLHEFKGDPRDWFYKTAKREGAILIKSSGEIHVGNEILKWPEIKFVIYN